MSRPVRLLEIVDSLQPGGMENMLVQILSRLDSALVKPEVLCLTRSGPFEARLPAHVKVHAFHKEDGFQWSVVSRLGRMMLDGAFDVVHTHHLGGLICFALARAWRRRPLLIHSEHLLWREGDLSLKRRWQRRLLYPLAAAVTTVSQQQVDQMRQMGFRHPRMFPIINGVDAERFRPGEGKGAARQALGLRQDVRWLGMVARFGPQKRHLDLIEAFERAASTCTNVHLLLLGDGGPLKEQVLQALERSPYRTRMVWAGFQPDPVPWYQALDVLVVSSSNEGMPNAVLEGMACGLPLMANDVCGVREIAIEGRHGWIRDLGDVERLAEGLRIATQATEAELKDFGQASRQHVLESFSLEAAVRKYQDVFLSPRGRD